MNASDILETTAATEPILDIASIKEAMDGFHPESLLPDLTKLFGHLPGLCRLAVMIGPVSCWLWGCCVENHIQAMRILWDSFSDDEKPEWTSLEEIERFSKKMLEEEIY